LKEGLMNTISEFTAKPTGRFFYHKVPAKFIVAENVEQGIALEFVTTTARTRKGAVHLLICRWIWITDEAEPAFFYHYPQFLNWELSRPTSRPRFKPDDMALPNYIQYARTGFSGSLPIAEASNPAPNHVDTVPA
jgi:hypothetical protein